MNGGDVVLNGVVDGVDNTDTPRQEPQEKRVTIDGPSLITDKMAVFMVRRRSKAKVARSSS